MNNLINYGDVERAIKIIREKENIFIASHINPDGDNIGSMLALALALKKINKNVYVLKSDFIPQTFKFLPGINLIKDYNENMGNMDALIVVDSSDENRLGKNKDLLKKFQHVINIDHHVSNTQFGDINIVDSKAAATGEMIYKLIKNMNIDLDNEIAVNLYTAISTDTGKFSYESVTSETHQIIAKLIDIGIDFNQINVQIYENMSMAKTKLFIEALSTLKTYKNDKVATVSITQDMLIKTGATMEDTEGIVSFVRKIGSVEVACLLKEIEKNDIKVSLRSKYYVNVASICECFDGGGHIRAAGCSLSTDIYTAEQAVVKKIKEVVR